MAASSENEFEFIVDCVQQYWPDISITRQLLEHPTSDFVIQFYQAFKDNMNNILCRMAHVATTAAEEQNPCVDSVFSILSFVNKYLKWSIPQFLGPDSQSLTLTDLYDPTAKKTRLIFKVLLNIMLFYEDNIESVSNVVKKRLDEAESLQSKKKEREVLREKLAAEAEKLAKAEEKCQKLQMEEEKANLRYKNLEKKKSENDKRHAEMKRDLEELVNTYKSKRTLLANVKTNIESLKEQTVTEESFKTLIDEKDALVTKCSELDAEIESLGENLGSRKPVIDRFDNINKELNILKSACEELRVAQYSASSADEQLQITSENYKKNHRELETCKENTLKCTERIKGIKEALQSATVKNNILMEKMQQQLKQLKVECTEEQKLQCRIARNKAVLEDEIEKLENEVEEIKSEIKDLNLSFRDTYKNMLTRENTSTINFRAALENIKDLLLQSEQNCSHSTENDGKS